MTNPANPERGFLNPKYHPRFLNSKAGRIIGAGAITIGSTLAALPLFDHDLTQAEVKSAESSRITPSQYPDDPIEFDYNGIHRKWLIYHGTLSFSGSGRGIDTIEDYYNGVATDYFQPQENADCYPEINRGRGVSIVITSQAVRVDRGKGVIQTLVSGNRPGYGHPKGGEIISLATPGDLGQRICLTSEGLPEEIWASDDAFSPEVWATDALGDYIERRLGNATDPSKNGRYRLRLNNLFQPMGIWIQQVRLYLPIILRHFPQ